MAEITEPRAGEDSREIRLFGDGSEDGGLPLPSALASVILTGIADSGPRRAEDFLPAAGRVLVNQGKIIDRGLLGHRGRGAESLR